MVNKTMHHMMMPILSRIREIRAKRHLVYRQSCAVPILETVEGELRADQLTLSRYAGLPYLKRGEKWPVCNSKRCLGKSQPQEFVLQIDLSEVRIHYVRFPAECETSQVPSGICDVVGREGLLQFFYCAMCCHPTECFEGNELVRIVHPKSKEKMSLPKVSVRSVSFPHSTQLPPNMDMMEFSVVQLITGWKVKDDYPGHYPYKLKDTPYWTATDGLNFPYEEGEIRSCHIASDGW